MVESQGLATPVGASLEKIVGFDGSYRNLAISDTHNSKVINSYSNSSPYFKIKCRMPELERDSIQIPGQQNNKRTTMRNDEKVKGGKGDLSTVGIMGVSPVPIEEQQSNRHKRKPSDNVTIYATAYDTHTEGNPFGQRRVRKQFEMEKAKQELDAMEPTSLEIKAHQANVSEAKSKRRQNHSVSIEPSMG